MLYQYLDHPSTTTVLILVHGSGEKPVDRLVGLTAHVEIDALTPELLRRWVASNARKSGIELAPDAVEHLIDAVGEDLGPLSMEIAKIAAAVSPDVPVTVEQVSQLAGVRRGETMVDWVEAVLQRDPIAVDLLTVVLSQPGVNAVKMVTEVGTALLGVRAARALLDEGTSPKLVADQLYRFLRQTHLQGVGLWSEEAKRWTRAAALWTGEKLEHALVEVLEADRALKTTSLTDERGILASLLIRLGQRRPAIANGAAA